MTSGALTRLLYHDVCAFRAFRKLINTSRALTSALWMNMKAMAEQSQYKERKEVAQAMRASESVYCPCTRGLECQPVSLVYLGYRRYSTYDKTTSTQILSKLFPQTSIELTDEQSRERRKREEEEELKEMERAWKRMKFGFVFFGIGGVIFSMWAVYFFGQPAIDEKGEEVIDEFSALPLAKQYMARTWKSLNRFQRFIQEPSSQKLLPDPLTAPYVQPPYTLVLEMKDLLIHPDWTYETGWRFKKRPGVDIFLRECSKYFEIVVYTAEQGITVFPLLDALDPNGYIMYRLVRDSTHFMGGHHVKNLDKLNRDLKRVVVIDWDKNSTKMHPGNSFTIPRWLGNDDDTTLFDLVSFLSILGSSDVDDVREVLQYYNQFKEPIAQFRENQRRLLEQMQADELEQKSKSRPMVKNWSRSFIRQ
ncbi:mitochondrial import inner membrane translocase subunit TIM50-B [Scaptodrosophila lebanonensis]|uniref:Mitochondrial import inner membrane translocase subunit TIM50 n=1 Tax=Drosophila lebanonensis TaxID=7225 RepID=A0A6J2UB65_DROLE|nr:mitochondrial import inner membrane translocase subunit TIM50-B [Scaptodrosophila lebanonensis]